MLKRMNDLYWGMYSFYDGRESNKKALLQYFSKERGIKHDVALANTYKTIYLFKKDCVELRRHLGEGLWDVWMRLFEGRDDRFYTDIIVFPIINRAGIVVNYIIRQIGSSTRFINTSLGYNALFGEHALSGRHFIIITEGLFDCLSLADIGLDSVAVLGTSNVKIANLEFIKNYEVVYILLDNDAPGEKAAEHLAIKLFFVYGIKAFIIRLDKRPGYNKTDVNDYRLTHSDDSFTSLILRAMSGAQEYNKIFAKNIEKIYLREKRALSGDDIPYKMIDVYRAFYPDGIIKGHKDKYVQVTCPFHSDNDPSFCIFHKTNTGKCFVCGEFVNPYTFVARLYKINIEKAKTLINERIGANK